MTAVLVRRPWVTVRKAKWWWRQRLEWLGQKPGNTWNHQELEEARNKSCLQTSWGLWPWVHLDFRLLELDTRMTSFTFHFHALEKEMAPHSSVLAWRIPGMAEPGGLPSMGSHRVRRDWSDSAAAAAASKNARQQIYCLPSLRYFVTAALRNLSKHHGVSIPWTWLRRFLSTKNTLSSLPAWTLPIHPSHPTQLFQVDFVDSLEEYWLQAGRGRAGDSIGPVREWYCFFQPPISLLFPL